jgi:hypothetical protein
VDHGVEATELVGAPGNFAGSGDARDVAFNDGLGLRQRAPRIRRARCVAGMQDDLVSLFDQQLAGHEA